MDSQQTAKKRKSHYVCFVPGCKTTSENSPNKSFFFAPRKNPERQKWITACRRDESKHKLSPSYHFQICQDHFNMEADLENYMRYKWYKENGFIVKAQLKPGVLPHKFDCQPTRLVTQKPPRRSVTEKLERKALVEEAFHQSTPETSSILTAFAEHPSAVEHVSEKVILQESSLVDKAVQTTFYFKGKPLCRSKFVQATPTVCSIGISAKRPLVSEGTQVTPKKKAKLEMTDSDSSSGTISRFSSGGSEWIATTSCDSSKEQENDLEKEEENYQKPFLLKCTSLNIQRNPENYLGVPTETLSYLHTVFTIVKCPKRDILLTIKRLKLNQPFFALADDFGLSKSQAAKIFSTTIAKMAANLSDLIYWPDKFIIKKNLPIAFRRRYYNVKAIIDCFEIAIQKPSDPLKQALTWSEYKKSNTVKYLIACTPNGFITLISNGYGGRTTDTNVANHCGVLNHLSEGDELMADRGFKLLAPALEQKGAKLVRPPSVKSGTKLSKEEAKEGKRIATLRIHVERAIGRVRTYKFVSPEARVGNRLIPLLDLSLIVVCALCNLQGRLIK